MLKLALVLMMCGVLVSQDDYNPEPQEPLVPKVDELKQMRREQIKSVLANVLMERYMRPFDDWVASCGYGKARIFTGNNFGQENWFALVIRDRSNTPIYVKFCVTMTFDSSDLGPTLGNEMISNYAYSTKRSLKAALEQTFILLLDDEEFRPSMVFGEPTLYQLPIKESDIEKLRKEDIVR